MKRLLVNCDQVFDVLTRGPFPTGSTSDEAVEQHLRACHECRQLAEALRPAVELLHEAVAAGEGLDLPEYQGTLACDLPSRRRATSTNCRQRSGTTLLTLAQPPRSKRLCSDRPASSLGMVRFIAATLLLAAFGLLAGGMLIAPKSSRSWADLSSGIFGAPADASLGDGAASAKSLLTLASLKLPATCLPLTHRPTSADHAVALADAISAGSLDALRCCTECHHAGYPRTASKRLIATTQQSCSACHRS